MRRHAIALGVFMALCFSALTTSSALAIAPTIPLTTFSSVTAGSVTLEADIHPQGKPTTWRFEYGLADCSTNPCTSIAGPGIPGGEFPVPKRVTASISGLTSGTTYHFRVVAKNPDGTTNSPDKVFAPYAMPIKGLPGGRAYEQASPVEKNGSDAIGTFPFVKATPTGDGVTFLSMSGISGGAGAQELPLYLADRGAAEWSTQGLLPPASFGERARVLGWLSDFSLTYSTVTKLGDPRIKALLARPSGGAPPLEIVPYTEKAEYVFAGATPDGSEVAFESAADLGTTPAGITGVSNVYVWDRDADKLSLAGVLNDGEVPAKGSFAGPYDWVQDKTNEGGSARDYYTQDEHAISPGAVYFTAAESGRLYLRRNPTKAQSPLDGQGKCTDPALACTLHVSASQKTNGKGPDGTDAAGPRPAAFMAASIGGNVAYFTSSEKLTNDANTGIEPELPAIARANINGSGADLTFLPADALGVAVDGTYAYWANPEAGTIGRATLDGTTEVDPDFIPAPDAGKPQWVAVSAGHIYWTNTGDGEDGNGTIGRADIDGDNPDLDFITGASNPQGIAVNATHVYWANGGKAGNASGLGRADLDGGSAEQSLGGLDWNAIGLALDTSYLYFSSDSGTDNEGFIRRIPLANLNQFPEVIVIDTGRIRGLAVDIGHIYWANNPASEIGRADLDGSDPESEFIKDAGRPVGLAVSAAHVYWSANQGAEPNPGNDLYRYEAATGTLTDLSADATKTNGAEVQGVLGVSDDGSYLYFVANGDFDGAGPASAGDCQGSLGSASGSCSLYLRHGGTTSFIARLSVNGNGSLTDAANWAETPTGPIKGSSFRKTATVAADGLTLLFRSQRKLTAYDNAGTSQLYRYRVGDPGPTCVSCNPTAPASTAAPSLGTINTSAYIPATPASVASRNLAANGDRVFFETTEAPVLGDTNGEDGCPMVGTPQQGFPSCQDVYMWEAEGTGSCVESGAESGGCLYLLSTGKDSYPSFFADASASGDDAFIFTRSRLVGQDQDELLDVYDARVGGGLASQNQPVPPHCLGLEACHGPPPAPLIPESAGSATFTGPSDPKPKRPKAKRHGKKKQHKKKQHKAGSNKGARR
jgi:hypothetical protein